MKTQEYMENSMRNQYLCFKSENRLCALGGCCVGNGLQQAQHFQCHEKAEGGGLCADRG